MTDTRNPQKADQAFDDGMAQHQAGELAKAQAAYQEAVNADGNFAEAHLNLGVVLHARGKLDDAIQSINRAMAINPQLAEAHYALAAVHQDCNNPEGAATGFTKALAIAPDFILALNGLAIAEQKLGHWEDAANAFERALAINPGFAEAANNLGNLRHKQGRMGDAMACFERALAVRPDYAKAHRNYAHVLLLAGRYKDGWREFLWRWKCDDFPTADRGFPSPHWQGEPLAGKKILVWSEQGVGDEVHFASMVPDLIEQGADVVLESNSRLVALFQRSFPGITCAARKTPPDPATLNGIDFQVPSGNLGHWFRPDLNSFPSRSGYLVSGQGRAYALKAKYRGGGDDLVVGIAWVSKNPEVGADKSMTLSDWVPLASIPGVTFVDLQYGDTLDERTAFEAATGTTIIRDDSVDQMADLDAFAAQVAAMDLVISVSNTIVHISGAQGIPTWVLLHAQPLCVWRQDGDTSPWYPSLSLLRQTEAGQWGNVIGDVETRLKALLSV